MELHGKAALVTGGAHRLGKAMALALGRAGMDVVIHYNSSEDEAQQTLGELRELGVRAEAVRANVAVVAEAERMVDEALQHLDGRLDVLVNSAGIWGADEIGSVTQERWDELMAINLRAMFFITQRAATVLKAGDGGAVINIADVGAFRPWFGYTPYLVSKGGVVTLTQTLAKDLAPQVRVNAIAPGPVLLPTDWDESKAQESARGTLLKRLGSPDDIAQAALYLAQARYVTGHIIPVDGGQHLL